MTHYGRFIKLLMKGWHKDIQHEIIMEMYMPIKQICTLMEKELRETKTMRISKIMDLTQKVISFYEQLVLKSFYPKHKVSPSKETSEHNVEDLVHEVGDEPQTKEKKEEDPLEKFHESMGIVKQRLDGVTNPIGKGGSTPGKSFAFLTEIRNFMEFIYGSMQSAKNLGGTLEAIKKSIEYNVAPFMVEKHVMQQSPFLSRKKMQYSPPPGDVIIE